MDVDSTSADRFAIDLPQEALDVLRRDRGELAAPELPHDPGSTRCSLSRVLGPGEQVPVTGERGRLGSLLEFQVLEPDVGGVLEAGISHPRSDLLLGFHFGDYPAHLAVRSPLVEKASRTRPRRFLQLPSRSGSSHARPSLRFRCFLVASRHFAS